MKKIILSKNKSNYTRTSFESVIDTSFKELGVKPISEEKETPTVSDFFRMYNELFYDIPESSPINSHLYLIEKSANYIGFEQNQEEIDALREEIAQLRTELLNTQKELITVQTNSPIIVNTNTGSI